MDCSSVNLITDESSPFKIIPVYDQKDSNICYAYSAAQMLDYYLIKNGAQKRSIHPAWLALNYALSKNRSGLDIGHTKEAIERLSEVQNCDFENVTSALRNWAGTEVLPESKIIAFIEKYSNTGRSPSFSDPASLKMLSGLRRLSLNPVEVISRILLPFCSIKSRINLPKIQKYNYSQLPDDHAFENFFLKRLSDNHTPLSIAYCSKVWKDPDYDGINLTLSGKRDSLKKDCNYHESLVVGKKMAGGSCQLLVRNTWGDKWRISNNKWKCLCKDRLTGSYTDDCDSKNHPDDAYSVEACWIPLQTLSKNVGVVTFME